MGERFSHAVVRSPSAAYAGCLRPEGVTIDMTRARIQHQTYVGALRQIGVQVTELDPIDLPDAVFVEDTAVALGDRIVLTRPGALSRRQEIMTVADFFEEVGKSLVWLEAGTLDGGDVMRIGGYVLIGQSERTDIDGFEALSEQVRAASMNPIGVPITDRVHLKTSCSAIDAVTILATASTTLPELPAVRILRVPAGEELAANCVAYDRTVVMAAGYPQTMKLLESHGFTPLPIDLSELQKGGGGATCLSIRY